jgi:hypothetical protein
MVFEDNNPTPKLAADSSCRPRSHQNGLVCCCGHSHGEDIFASKKCSKCGGPREPGRYLIGNSLCRACLGMVTNGGAGWGMTLKGRMWKHLDGRVIRKDKETREYVTMDADGDFARSKKLRQAMAATRELHPAAQALAAVVGGADVPKICDEEVL